MSLRRAYTHLDRIRVVLGNEWLEREWSSMLGNTVALMQKAGDVEWLAMDSTETRIVVEGTLLGLTDLGAPEWSDEQTPFGAIVSAQYAGARFGLRLWTMALHEHPCLLRGGELRNGAAPLTLDTVGVEEIPVVHAVCEEDTLSPAEYPWPDGAGAVAIRRPGKCLVAAYRAPLAVRTLEGALASYRFETGAPVTLAPGERMALPDLLLLLGRGEPAQVMGAAYPAAVRTVREYYEWQQERLRDH